MWGPELAVMAAMIAVNAVFAAYEIALASVSRARLQHLATERRPGAAVALAMKQNMEGSLAVVQLGITLVGAVAAAVGGAGAEETLSPMLQARWALSDGAAEAVAITMVVLPLTVVTITVGELIPKVFALRNAERVCLALSPPMRAFSYAVRPVVWMFETIVKRVMSWGESRLGSGGARETAELQEIRATATLARSASLIGHTQERIILNATEMQSRPVRSIMLAAEDMVTLAADATLADNMIAAHLDMHTRFPVVERPGDPQSVIGYANFKDIVSALRMSPRDPSFRAIVRAIPSLRDDTGIAASLEQMMRERTHIALVRDAAGRVAGLVTMEDILEELVGEIEDEYDRLPSHLAEAGRAWIAGGGVMLERLRTATGLDLAADGPPGGARTLNDWVRGHLGREARGGDIVERGTVRVAVRKVRRQRVQEALVGQDPATARPIGAAC